MSHFYESLISWVEKKYGIVIQEHQSHRVQSALDNLEYIQKNGKENFLLGMYEQDNEVVKSIVEIFTVQESYFFRDQSLFNLLKNKLFPNLIKEKKTSRTTRIKVWCAACSRGEEIYSIAILLNELIPNIKEFDLCLIGTDINEKSLRIAKSGIFSKSSMRIADDYYKNKYFTFSDNAYVISPIIRDMVDFQYQNLAEFPYKINDCDFIFCRNAFIYFDRKVIENSLKEFDNCLNFDGKLFLGQSDIVSHMKNPMRYHFEDGVVFYMHNHISKCEVTHNNQEKHDQSLSYMSKQSLLTNRLGQIKKELDLNPRKALDLIDAYLDENDDSVLMYQYKAEALFKLNDISTALETCEIALKKDSLNPKLNLIKGILLFEKTPEIAEVIFKRILFTNPNMIEANYYLSQISLLKKNSKTALYYLKATLKQLEISGEKLNMLGFGEINTCVFIDDIKSEIKTLISDQSHER